MNKETIQQVNKIVTIFEQLLKKEKVLKLTSAIIYKQYNIKYEDILLYLNMLESELMYITTVEHDLGYDYQLQTTLNLIPKEYCFIVDREGIEELEELTPELIKLVPDKFEETLKRTSVVAYKFQLKYYLTILENLIRLDIWNNNI